MKREVKNLPKNALFDYIDVFGIKHYHTSRRRYEVSEKVRFGRRERTIFSDNLEE